MATFDFDQFIEEVFEENFDIIRSESGHSITPRFKKQALQQIKLYWQKMQKVAENVTETEVLLTLPLQKTPAGRVYTLQGVVDLVNEDGHNRMYDLKTHEAELVRQQTDKYVEQISVYKHIWQTLRSQTLDSCHIIATKIPSNIKNLLDSDQLSAEEKQHLSEQLAEWEPLIDIETDQSSVEQFLEKFGQTIDNIEDGKFAPPDYDRLTKRDFLNEIFAVNVCRNCDVRFSCDSYREYAKKSGKVRDDFYKIFEDDDEERTERLDEEL